jgi:hypothetical protein
MKGTRILVTSEPRGVYEDIIVVGTPKPGVCMEIATVEPVGGIYSHAVYGTRAASGGQGVTADGDRKAIAILLERDQDGSTFDDAYVDGDYGRVYYPAMGEFVNMRFEDVAGTGDDNTIGEEMMVDDGTGKLLTADSDAEAHPFTCLETTVNPLADHLELCRFNGEGGA